MSSDADFSGWIGKSETEEGIVSAYPANCFAMTLDRDDPSFVVGSALPPGWHYFYFHELVALADTGDDGHKKRGGFMPPIPFPRRMWAGSKMEFSTPLLVGEKVKKVVTIDNIEIKDGKTGPLCFVTTKEEVFGADGRLATLEERKQVYRENPGPNDSEPKPAPAAPVWSRTIHPDPVLLFRYSALTMNSHRIHYDKDYVRDIEGYPGLLVHGPLTMTLMLDLFRRELPNATITSFNLRAVAPIYDTTAFSVHGNPEEGDQICTLWAMTGEGALAMTAEVLYAL